MAVSINIDPNAVNGVLGFINQSQATDNQNKQFYEGLKRDRYLADQTRASYENTAKEATKQAQIGADSRVKAAQIASEPALANARAYQSLVQNQIRNTNEKLARDKKLSAEQQDQIEYSAYLNDMSVAQEQGFLAIGDSFAKKHGRNPTYQEVQAIWRDPGEYRTPEITAAYERFTGGGLSASQTKAGQAAISRALTVREGQPLQLVYSGAGTYVIQTPDGQAYVNENGGVPIVDGYGAVAQLMYGAGAGDINVIGRGDMQSRDAATRRRLNSPGRNQTTEYVTPDLGDPDSLLGSIGVSVSQTLDSLDQQAADATAQANRSHAAPGTGQGTGQGTEQTAPPTEGAPAADPQASLMEMSTDQALQQVKQFTANYMGSAPPADPGTQQRFQDITNSAAALQQQATQPPQQQVAAASPGLVAATPVDNSRFDAASAPDRLPVASSQPERNWQVGEEESVIQTGLNRARDYLSRVRNPGAPELDAQGLTVERSRHTGLPLKPGREQPSTIYPTRPISNIQGQWLDRGSQERLTAQLTPSAVPEVRRTLGGSGVQSASGTYSPLSQMSAAQQGLWAGAANSGVVEADPTRRAALARQNARNRALQAEAAGEVSNDAGVVDRPLTRALSLGQATQKVRDVKRVLAPSVNKISRAGFGAKKNTEAARLMEALREIGALRPPADGGRDPQPLHKLGEYRGIMTI